MSDTESDTEIPPAVELETKTITAKRKPRAKMTDERLAQLSEMRERAKLVAQAKRELKADGVTSFKIRDPAVAAKVAEIEKRGKDSASALTRSVVRGQDPEKVTRAESTVEAPKPVTTNAVVKPDKKPKNKRIVYVSSTESSDSEEEVVIKKPKAKKTYQWTQQDIEELKQRELDMRMKKMEEQDEFARMEKAMLQKRYADKLKEVQKSQLAKFMFGGR